jgi:hypothetical protein
VGREQDLGDAGEQARQESTEEAWEYTTVTTVAIEGDSGLCQTIALFVGEQKANFRE